MDNFVYGEILEEELSDEEILIEEIYEDDPIEVQQLSVTAVTDVQTAGNTVYGVSETAAANTENNITMEVHNDEFTQSAQGSEGAVSEETQMAVTAVTEISEEYEAEGTETAVSTVPSETGIMETISETSAVTENPADTASANNNVTGFLLLAGVFGAAVAAAVYMTKFKKKKINDDTDLSQLSAKERDAVRLNGQKKKKPKKKKNHKKRIVARTVQKTLPYKSVCDEYIFKVDENKYSKTYRFEDINYSIAKQEEQEGIFLGYCSVLNSFDTNADIQVTVHNNRVNKTDFNKMVLLKHKGDSFDHYIDVYNDMLIQKMEQGQNGIIRKKYLTVTIQSADLETAKSKFNSIDLELVNAFKKIGSPLIPLTSNERINLLKDIFRGVDVKIPELTEKDFKRQAERAYCCPDYFEFKKDYFMWNDKYARTMFIKDMPASLKDYLLTDIANTNLDVKLKTHLHWVFQK